MPAVELPRRLEMYVRKAGAAGRTRRSPDGSGTVATFSRYDSSTAWRRLTRQTRYPGRRLPGGSANAVLQVQEIAPTDNPHVCLLG